MLTTVIFLLPLDGWMQVIKTRLGVVGRNKPCVELAIKSRRIMDVTAMLFTRMNSAPTAKREQRDLSTTVKITDPFSTREGHR